MTLKDLEDLYYTYGQICYQIGRMETDGNTAAKKYDKLVEERDYMRNSIEKWLATLQKVVV